MYHNHTAIDPQYLLTGILGLFGSLNILVKESIDEAGKPVIHEIDKSRIDGVVALKDDDTLLQVLLVLAKCQNDLILIWFIQETILFCHAPVGYERNTMLEAMNLVLESITFNPSKGA